MTVPPSAARARGNNGEFRPAGLGEGDTADLAVVEGAVYALVERAGAQLRRLSLAARRLDLTVDYSDGLRAARSVKVDPATSSDFRLFAAARVALARSWTRRARLRHLRLVCERLVFPPAQLELFPEDAAQARRETGLLAALDAIRAKFGWGAIRVGRAV